MLLGAVSVGGMEHVFQIRDQEERRFHPLLKLIGRTLIRKEREILANLVEQQRDAETGLMTAISPNFDLINRDLKVNS